MEGFISQFCPVRFSIFEFYCRLSTMLKKRVLKAALLVLVSTFLVSCKTTSSLQRSFEKAEPHEENYITQINRNLEYTKEDFENQKFIFIRLHHINYKKGSKFLYAWRGTASLMGHGTDGNIYTHTAMNCTLDDDFVGITTRGENQVKVEKFRTPEENIYFQRIDMNKTSCAVMAVPVSREDWENCRKLLEYSLNPRKDFKFSKPSALSVPFKHGKARKALKNYDFERDFEPIVLDSDYAPYFEKDYKFACSGFVMKILSIGSAKYNSMFNDKNLKAVAFAPSELMYLNRAEILFICRASCYDKAVKDYLDIYPEFAQYFSKK